MRILPILAALLLAGCSAAPAPSADYVLTYASPYPPSHPFGLADQEWMRWVTAKSGGRIAFKPYWSGALLSSDMSMEEIRHGIADIGLITPIYSRGGAHLLRGQAAFMAGCATFPIRSRFMTAWPRASRSSITRPKGCTCWRSKAAIFPAF